MYSYVILFYKNTFCLYLVSERDFVYLEQEQGIIL